MATRNIVRSLALLSLLVTDGYCDDYSIFTTVAPVKYEIVTKAPVTYESKGCGWRQRSGITDRVVSTAVANANFGEFPWVVAIFRHNETTSEYQYICVGSLIHPRAVLSVKHYFKESSRIRIRAGDWDITGDYEIRYHQSSDVAQIESHPKYNPLNNAYDVALLFLSTQINLAPNVAFACLPPPATLTDPGARCLVAGWGYETFINGTIRNILKKVELPKVENDICQSQLSKILRRNIVLDRSMMCAGGEAERDACLKDGGAPLVCPYQGAKNRYYQAGIVSWGVRCGLAGIPGVYTNVAVVRPWIDQIMRKRGYNIDTYIA